MGIDHPYHEGERAVQERAHERRRAGASAAVIADRIPRGALRFIEQQPMAVVGSVDPAGRVWASVLFGKPGFLRARDDRTLELDRTAVDAPDEDPLWRNLPEHPEVGVLVIELASRRRLRINGHARRLTEELYGISVERAYPNCPKYIQRRRLRATPAEQDKPPAKRKRGDTLTEAQQAWIAAADTLFVASAHPEHGVDASHRGGRPGFVRVLDARRLRIPDFAGNGMFNTLGNFMSYPHAGLAFIDFARGRALQLSGRPEILWDLDDPDSETGGTRRYWLFETEAWRESALPCRLEWELLESSPFLPGPNA